MILCGHAAAIISAAASVASERAAARCAPDVCLLLLLLIRHVDHFAAMLMHYGQRQARATLRREKLPHIMLLAAMPPFVRRFRYAVYATMAMFDAVYSLSRHAPPPLLLLRCLY